MPFLFLAGCAFVLPDNSEVTVLSWNVENLFDAVDQGSEYPEYTSDGGWTERDYTRRLQRVSEAVHTLRPRPDIMVFLEIENADVLATLVGDFIVDINAPYHAFAVGPGAAIGIGLASRYPITEVRTHLPRTGDFPPLRPVLEVHLDLADESLVVLCNHWKSKRGGAPATEPLRRATAALLTACLRRLHREDPDRAVIVVGDFNARPREFELTGRSYPTALMPANEVRHLRQLLLDDRSDERSDQEELPSWVTEEWFTAGAFLLLAPDAISARNHTSALDMPVLVNLWDSIDASGSYYFINRWERIDSIFASPSLFNGAGLEYGAFTVPCPAGACDDQGRPLSWTDGEHGVSDHLPLLLTITRPER